MGRWWHVGYASLAALSDMLSFAREAGLRAGETAAGTGYTFQVFVIAPAQCGRHNEERASHGRSMIVDPWGLVLARGGDRPCVIVADCDLSEQDRVRAAIPCLQNRRL